MNTFLNRTKIMFILMICLCFAISMSTVCAASDDGNIDIDNSNALEIEQSNDSVEIALSVNGALDADDVNDVDGAVDADDVDSVDDVDDVDSVDDDTNNDVTDANDTVPAGGKTPDYNQTVIEAYDYSDFIRSNVGNNRGIFAELNQAIANLKPGDTLDLEKDYFDIMSYSSQEYPIIISVDNITINGNGHIIDGSIHNTFIKITGNNVKINNVTFINSECVRKATYQYIVGPINYTEESLRPIIYDGGYNPNPAKYVSIEKPIKWTGENGAVSDCNFYTIKKSR